MLFMMIRLVKRNQNHRDLIHQIKKILIIIILSKHLNYINILNLEAVLLIINDKIEIMIFKDKHLIIRKKD